MILEKSDSQCRPWYQFDLLGNYEKGDLYVNVPLLIHSMQYMFKYQCSVRFSTLKFKCLKLAAKTYVSCTHTHFITIFQRFKSTSLKFGVTWTIFSTLLENLYRGCIKRLSIWKTIAKIALKALKVVILDLENPVISRHSLISSEVSIEEQPT